MNEKCRIEYIVEAIVSHSTKQNIIEAWKVCRSESAKAEAEMIGICHSTQSEISNIMFGIRQVDLRKYTTDDYKRKIKRKLGFMIGNCDSVARDMITSNILAGKLKAVLDSGEYKNSLEIIKLTDDDYMRIDNMINECVGRIHKGAALTAGSVDKMLNNLSININSTPDADSSDIEQTPVDYVYNMPSVDANRPNVVYRQIIPTLREIQKIKEDPVSYSKNFAKNNIDSVKGLHKKYLSDEENRKKLQQKFAEELRKVSSGSSGNSKARILVLSLGASVAKGLYSFSDKGGKRWSLSSYGAMTARNAAASSTNLAEVFADSKHDLYYIKPHAGSCPLCKRFEGKVYSRSGTNPKYPPLASAFSKVNPSGSNDISNTYMTIHPNCRHKIIKYFENDKPKLVNDEMIKKSNEPINLSSKEKRIIIKSKENDRAWNGMSALYRKRMAQKIMSNK